MKIRGQDAVPWTSKTENLGQLTDLIAMHISMGYEKRQEILECLDLERRYELVSSVLMEEVNISRIREAYRNKVKEEVDKNQKEYFLREQMKVIRNELGDEGGPEDYAENTVPSWKNCSAAMKCERPLGKRSVVCRIFLSIHPNM